MARSSIHHCFQFSMQTPTSRASSRWSTASKLNLIIFPWLLMQIYEQLGAQCYFFYTTAVTLDSLFLLFFFIFTLYRNVSQTLFFIAQYTTSIGSRSIVAHIYYTNTKPCFLPHSYSLRLVITSSTHGHLGCWFRLSTSTHFQPVRLKYVTWLDNLLHVSRYLQSLFIVLLLLILHSPLQFLTLDNISLNTSTVFYSLISPVPSHFFFTHSIPLICKVD